jgi:hypothetical protein
MFSLIRGQYPRQTPYGSPARNNALQFNLNRYIQTWGIVTRNPVRRVVNYAVYQSF